MTPRAQAILRELQRHADPERAAVARRFFKTGPGQYGEGDAFLGLAVPVSRQIARRFQAEVAFADIAALLASPWHEARFVALVFLVQRAKKAGPAEQKILAEFYLAHRERVNNWDLVDISAAEVPGPVVCGDPARLWRLARSGKLWEERIAMIATFHDIRRGRFENTVALAEHFLPHPHDLIHKAAGWMLREAGKRDLPVLLSFLDQHAAGMPRTMLRYSLEKLPPAQRAHYMRQGSARR